MVTNENDIKTAAEPTGAGAGESRPQVVKTTVNLPPDALEALKEIANSRATSVSDVIRRAIWMEKFLHDAVQAGGKILIQDPKENVKEIILR